VRRLSLTLALLVGCGGGLDHTRTTRLDRDLAAIDLDAQRAQASTFTARAEVARDAALRSENESDLIAADEYASIARAWAEAARAESEVRASEVALADADAEHLQVQSELAALEQAASLHEAEATHAASQRATREEVARALLRAEADEAVPRRARHVGLGTPADVAPLADALIDRTRLLLAAGEALGAPHDSPARIALNEAAALRMPGERLAAASRAHDLAQRALADARRRSAGPSDAEIASFDEALSTQNFAPLRDAHGLGTELTDAFEGTRIRASIAPRVRRLAALLAGHPHGGIFMLVECAAGSEAEAQRRVQAMSTVLTSAATREVHVEVIASANAGRVRVTLPAYVTRGPQPASAGGAHPSSSSEEGATSGE
jgi:hypothetical protein